MTPVLPVVHRHRDDGGRHRGRLDDDVGPRVVARPVPVAVVVHVPVAAHPVHVVIRVLDVRDLASRDRLDRRLRRERDRGTRVGLPDHDSPRTRPHGGGTRAHSAHVGARHPGLGGRAGRRSGRRRGRLGPGALRPSALAVPGGARFLSRLHSGLRPGRTRGRGHAGLGGRRRGGGPGGVPVLLGDGPDRAWDRRRGYIGVRALVVTGPVPVAVVAVVPDVPDLVHVVVAVLDVGDLRPRDDDDVWIALDLD